MPCVLGTGGISARVIHRPHLRACLRQGEVRQKGSRRGHGGDDRHHKQRKPHLEAAAKPRSKRQKRRDSIIDRDGILCHYCAAIGTTLDHVVPACYGGTYALDNLVMACRPCNHARDNMNYVVFCALLRRPVDWDRYRLAIDSVKAADEVRRAA